LEDVPIAVSRGARLASLLGNNNADRKLQLKGQEETTGKSSTMSSLKGATGSAIKAFENIAH